MKTTPPGRRIVPVALGIAMLAVVVAAGLAPNVGVAQASSGCSYGTCTASTPFPWWALSAIVVVVLAAIIAALLLLRRRRREPPVPDGPAQAWQGGAAGEVGVAAEAPMPPAGDAAPYVETPEDVGQAPPYEATEAAVGTGAATGTAVGSEPDIDSLMAELDKISGEILKRNPKKGTDQPSTDDTDGDSSS